jgi:ClpP class serine protease
MEQPVDPKKPEAKVPTQVPKEPPVLYSRTQTDIGQLSRLLGGPLIAYWNNSRGSVCQNDVIALYAILEKLGAHDTLYLLIKSGGGTGQASLRLVSLLRQHCKRLVALVPLDCASAATMIALGCNEIRMGPMAYLTAVDTSLNHALSPVDRHNDRVSVSLDELTRVIRRWGEQSKSTENPYKALFEHVHPLVIGAVDRAESLSIMLCRQLLAYHIKDEGMANAIAETLNSKYPSHNYPILLEEAKKIGLQVQALAPEINDLLLDLNERYSEMGQRATTDFDEQRSHSNEILNIWEAADIQVYYQEDKDWFYRSEERRWITMNDNSSWRRIERVKDKIRRGLLHIA